MITFRENTRRALADEKLRVVRRVTDRSSNARLQAAGETEDWESLRRRAREIKREAIEHLDRHLEELEKRVTANGGTVFWARDGKQAGEYIRDLALQRGIKIAVKGKSMTSEEVRLNEVLEEAHVQPVETDLGEYIIQLARESPSHIILPAIHKSKEDVSELFTKELRLEPTREVEVLTAAARKVLRGRFIEAGLGISGANFAVAETGTIVIVENEGNVRFSTSAPKVHVAIMGIEKVLPRFEHLAPFLRLLPRSATGQRITSYVSFINGPKRPGEEDGPEEFHLVLLDNGRSRILADPEARETLYCIRCGACLNVCPVYQRVGGHAYGWVYPGPIGAILTPQLLGMEHAPELPHASSLCGACKDACPVRINIPKVLLHLRRRSVESPPGRPRWERWLVRTAAWVMESPFRYEWASRIGRLLQRFVPRLPVPPLAATPLRKRVP